MIDHNVMRLDVAVHNALAVAEVEGLEEFVDVEPHIEVVELGVQAAEIGIVDVLEDERRRLALQCRSRDQHKPMQPEGVSICNQPASP